MKVFCMRTRGIRGIIVLLVGFSLIYFARKHRNIIKLIKTKAYPALVSFATTKEKLPSDLVIKKFGLHKTFLLKEYSEPRNLYNFTLKPENVTHVIGNAGLSEISMVVVVKSKSGNRERRQVIRATWASSENQRQFNMFTVFIVGSTENQELQYNLLEESKKHGDILQTNAEEDYDLVIHKTLAAMQWFTENFSRSWLFSSADDDIVVDTKKLFNQIEALRLKVRAENKASSTDLNRFPVYCGFRLSKNSCVIRNKANKWFISKSYYPFKRYPPYCLGPFYTMSFNMASLISMKSRYLIPFQIDDVWVTGILRLVVQENLLKYTENQLESGITSPRVKDIPVLHIPDHMIGGESLTESMERYWKEIEQK